MGAIDGKNVHLFVAGVLLVLLAAAQLVLDLDHVHADAALTFAFRALVATVIVLLGVRSPSTM